MDEYEIHLDMDLDDLTDGELAEMFYAAEYNLLIADSDELEPNFFVMAIYGDELNRRGLNFVTVH